MAWRNNQRIALRASRSASKRKKEGGGSSNNQKMVKAISAAANAAHARSCSMRASSWRACASLRATPMRARCTRNGSAAQNQTSKSSGALKISSKRASSIAAAAQSCGSAFGGMARHRLVQQSYADDIDAVIIPYLCTWRKSMVVKRKMAAKNQHGVEA